MAIEKKELTDLQAISRYFGRKPGQTIGEFRDELKDLSPAEKKWLADGARVELDPAI